MPRAAPSGRGDAGGDTRRDPGHRPRLTARCAAATIADPACMTTHSIRYRERAARDGEHLPAEPTCTELAHLRAAITLAEANLMRAKTAICALQRGVAHLRSLSLIVFVMVTRRKEARKALCASSGRRTRFRQAAFPQIRDTVWSGTGSNCRPSAFQGSYHPGSGHFQGKESVQVTRIGADHLACKPILAVVPPCAVECRLVRVTGVLIFVNGRTCVAFVLLAAGRSTIVSASVSGPGGPARGSLANCRDYPSARPPSSPFRCHAGNNVP
jgi:hypothetical protein